METKLVPISDVLSALPENIATRAGELLAPRWDSGGRLPGHAVFLEVIHAYQDLGIPPGEKGAWSAPDVIGCLKPEVTVSK